MRPPRALAARGALLGASGGVAAGLVDFALAASRAGAFLPAGRYKLALFLCALYGTAGAVLLALVGLVLGAVFWATDAGALWRAAFKDEESDGARWLAYALAAAGSLALVGVALQPIALFALRYFHHRALRAALAPQVRRARRHRSGRVGARALRRRRRRRRARLPPRGAAAHAAGAQGAQHRALGAGPPRRLPRRRPRHRPPPAAARPHAQDATRRARLRRHGAGAAARHGAARRVAASAPARPAP